ncbi:MAG TPA: hypothetical protein VLQ20_01570 [Planococcus sp. (in: firmicutes)]|nr:hypothetical protein [Planococcus sp. (in: firmicutes)]
MWGYRETLDSPFLLIETSKYWIGQSSPALTGVSGNLTRVSLPLIGVSGKLSCVPESLTLIAKNLIRISKKASLPIEVQKHFLLASRHEKELHHCAALPHSKLIINSYTFLIFKTCNMQIHVIVAILFR